MDIKIIYPKPQCLMDNYWLSVYKIYYFIFLSFATKKPSYTSLGHTVIVYSRLGSKGISKNIALSIGSSTTLPSFKTGSSTASFSAFKTEQVEYTSVPPFFKIDTAFLSKACWLFTDFSTSLGVKYLV